MILDDRARGLLDGRAVAVLATLNPDGTPQTSVIWAAWDGDVLIFSTHDQRREAQDLRRDPRASVTVFAADDPYRTAGIAQRQRCASVVTLSVVVSTGAGVG